MARKKRGWKRLARFSLGDLQRLMGMKQAEIEQMRGRRDELAAKIAGLNDEIEAAGGSVPTGSNGAEGMAVHDLGTKRKGRGRPAGKGKRGRRTGAKGPGSLEEAIRAALKGSKDPMRIADLAAAVKKGGYKSKSANFGVILGQRLAEMRDVKRVGRGVYAMR